MAKAVLCILDGFGFGDKNDRFNAVEQANTPVFDYLKNKYEIINLKTSGESVGLPNGQMGNSEVGHMTIGCGRVVYQSLPRINNAIVNDEIKDLPAIRKLIDSDIKTVHLIGLLSDGGVHSYGNHVLYLSIILKKAGKNVVVHAISDGRDCPPNSGLEYLSEFNEKCKITTLCGRFFAMDRDGNNERTDKYRDLIALGRGDRIEIADGIKNAYLNGINDEHIEPIVCDDYCGMQSGEAVVFCNFRADRVRQIAKKMLAKNEFKLSMALFMTDYFSDNEVNNFVLKPDILFEKINLKDSLSEVLSNNNLTQLHVAETEKYAHVTFFFNGGVEKSFAGEDRILVPSPKVKTYDLKPEMSCEEVIKQVINNIQKYDFIVLNIANCDMVGHTGNFEAAKKAVEFVDKQLGLLVKQCEDCDISLLITADHGNAECMMDKDNHKHTQHTTLDVPLILISKNYGFIAKEGDLSDIAPTLLRIFDIKRPVEMTGNLLIEAI